MRDKTRKKETTEGEEEKGGREATGQKGKDEKELKDVGEEGKKEVSEGGCKQGK